MTNNQPSKTPMWDMKTKIMKMTKSELDTVLSMVNHEIAFRKAIENM